MTSSYQLLRKIKFGEHLEDDDDPLDTIQNRLEEISLMVKSKAKLSNQLDTMDPEQRTRIMKFKHLSSQQIRDQRRRDFKGIDRFRDAVLMVLLLHRASWPRKKYLHVNEVETTPGALKRMKDKTDWENQNTSKSTLGMEVQLALSTQPEYRSPADLKRVTWILRATKAFQHLFPSQFEGELARVLAYERYEDRRIVAYQGEQPERFYYILRGELQKVKEYRLMSGVITRNEGVIRKGSTTDPEEMEHQWPREHHLVTKGAFECLILERIDFLRLQHTSKGPPVDFLQSLDLFKEFPCDELVSHPESLQFKYYGKDMMIVKDTHRTPWIHIVKTGTVRVVRIQNVLDVHNDALFASQTVEELGCKRTFSHAKSMIGTLEKQRKNKQANANAVSFPEITRRHKHLADSGPPKSHSASPEDEAQTEATVMKPQRKKPKLMKSPIIVDPFGGRNSAKTRPTKLPDIMEDSPNYESEIMVDEKNAKENEKPSQNGIVHTEEKPFFLPPIPNAEGKRETVEHHDYLPHGTYLTRERTDFDTVYSQKLRNEPRFRRAYIQLDVLRVGDIFGMETIAESLKAKASMESDDTGLEHLDPPLASEPPGVSLISDGAEVIRISKRFFLQFAKNNTMLKVETMQREYMSPDEARSILYEKETWNQYKSVLLQKTVENLAKKKLEVL
ncbi:hypothetical protein CHS0354_006049 [Potamilus streckersoni]|uniref:Cyclic nucleotide-binding domain-containing protein n=1 Tax=Potamilus streckersoni TaxID=2493646 RepID=A0AAE0S3M7_9BIVA|nr:hypothetical protein CHS0354_006049 [Potamilus streckersoni]